MILMGILGCSHWGSTEKTHGGSLPGEVQAQEAASSIRTLAIDATEWPSPGNICGQLCWILLGPPGALSGTERGMTVNMHDTQQGHYVGGPGSPVLAMAPPPLPVVNRMRFM
jgi:hypothetical protein